MLQGILEIGSDLRFYSGGGNIGCPSMLIGGMTIGGKNDS